MSKYEPVAQQRPIQSDDSTSQGRRRFVYTLPTTLKLYLATIIFYAVLSLAITVWTLRGPHLSFGKRVLVTGDITVDQFYSGLVLSMVLAPAGILVRRISNDLAYFHPFAIASKASIPMADLDRMMDPGIFAAKTAFQYSHWHSFLQMFLLTVGALLVPIGTLLVTTGEYAPTTNATAVIGLPTGNDVNIKTVSVDSDYWLGGETGLDYFLNATDDLTSAFSEELRGAYYAQTASLTSANRTLGPLTTPNLTYEEGTQYNGVVTYSWDAGCSAADDMDFNIPGEPDLDNVDFTFHNRTVLSIDAGGTTPLGLWIDPENSIETPKATYYAIASELDIIGDDSHDALTIIKDGKAITRVKCLPSLQWEVSSCWWREGSMADCKSTPGHNTTELDVDGLDLLKRWMAGLPWALFGGAGETVLVDMLTSNPNTTDFRHPSKIPTLKDFINLYGLIARSIAAVTLSGLYGVATVPTYSGPPKPVYVVRTYILGLLVAMLVSVALLVAFDLLYHWARHLPWRKSSFLTIASAVRGPWWDETLDGVGAVPLKELRKRFTTKIMFGADRENPEDLCFGPDVDPIHSRRRLVGRKT